MMASPLKASVGLDPAIFGGPDTEYAQKYGKVQEAEQRLMELLEQRISRAGGLDLGMLAIAGEMLDPGKTGSFGEAIGRAAKAYGPARMAADKELSENAMLQMQLAQMGMERARKSQALKELTGLTTQVTPEGGTGPVQGDTSGPAVMSKGRILTPAIIGAAMRYDPELGKSLETEYKLRLESMGIQPTGTVDKITGKFTPFPGAEQKKEFVPELGGDIMMSSEDAMAIRAARNEGDTEAVYSIIDKYQGGVGAYPGRGRKKIGKGGIETPEVDITKPGEEPKAEGEPTKDITISGRETRAAIEKEKGTTMAKEQAERTTKFLNSADESRLARAAAAQNIEILQRNPKIVGYLNKPGVGNALWQVVQDSLRTHSASGRAGLDVDIKQTDIEKALMKVDPAFKPSDFTDLDVLVSNLARMELGLRRQTYAGSGMGAVSNMEGQPIRDTLGNKYDTPEALRKKMAMAGRAFDFDMDVAAAYRKYVTRPGNENKTLEEFKRDPKDRTYDNLTRGFEKWLADNLRIPYRKQGSSADIPNRNAILDEAKRRAEKRKKEGVK